MELQDSLWTPVLLHCLTLLHFSLSTILIISYWHLKVRRDGMLAFERLLMLVLVTAGSADHLQAREACCPEPGVEQLESP